jgi:DNA-binding beta-propeller fold protein YncE
MIRRIAIVALLLVALTPLTSVAWNSGPVETFATLPAGATPPEGITADSRGNVYVTTFGFPASGPTSDPGLLIAFDRNGRLLRSVPIAGASAHLLGLAFNPVTGDLLVLDFGAGNVLKVDPVTGASTVFSSIGAGSGLNALTFDQAGNAYVSDSFQGTIWKIPPAGGAAAAWVTDPLLTTTGKPPFGANGVAFNKDGSALFVANTGDDAVIRIPVSGGAAGTPSVLAYSINGADGLLVDANDNIWVVANQSDEVVVLDSTGKAIAKLGDFNGIDRRGAAVGLLFPASLVFHGEDVLVTNLVLDTRLFGFQTLDSQWAAQVTRYTISKLKKRIPVVRGGDEQ